MANLTRRLGETRRAFVSLLLVLRPEHAGRGERLSTVNQPSPVHRRQRVVAGPFPRGGLVAKQEPELRRPVDHGLLALEAAG